MNRKPYITGEYYHIYNRGVEKRKIFLTKNDYERFLFILDAFNTTESINRNQVITRQLVKGSTFNKLAGQKKDKRKTKKFVEIDEYCLMPNHFHLLLRQLEEGGISKFLQRVMTGYTMYFNTKYKRDGVLFQGRHKSRHVNTEPYLFWLRQYIHINPLDLFVQGWKENGVPKFKRQKAIDFLNDYKWVSCSDYSKYWDIFSGWDQERYQSPK